MTEGGVVGSASEADQYARSIIMFSNMRRKKKTSEDVLVSEFNAFFPLLKLIVTYLKIDSVVAKSPHMYLIGDFLLTSWRFWRKMLKKLANFEKMFLATLLH